MYELRQMRREVSGEGYSVIEVNDGESEMDSLFAYIIVEFCRKEVLAILKEKCYIEPITDHSICSITLIQSGVSVLSAPYDIYGFAGRIRRRYQRRFYMRSCGMKRVVSWYGRILSLITFLVLISAGFFMIPRLWGWEPLIVMSGSMEPTIPTGSVLFTDTRNREPMDGDIITYQLEQQWEKEAMMVTHRVVRLEARSEGTVYVTKGDANQQEDFVPVREHQITGIYVFHVPKVGAFMSKFDRKLWITAALWLLLLNILGILLNSIWDAV